ncbi:hypothetical protein [Glycomyces sp. MUSA5-2]|uniref:hypothetical protein n=1 Tax=Glycomyces sp. MUSA5-2 TaxID=2053002 RepID=UPI00300B789A
MSHPPMQRGEQETAVVPGQRDGTAPDAAGLRFDLVARAPEVQGRIEAHLHQQCGVDTQAVRDCFIWNGLQSEVDPGGELDVEDVFLRRAGEVFEEQAALTPDSVDRALLCLWVHHSSVRAWNHTYRVDLLMKCMLRFRDIVRRDWALKARPVPEVELALRLCELVRLEIELEDCLKTGSQLRYSEALDMVIGSCRGLLHDAEDDAGPVGVYVRGEVAVRREYHVMLRRLHRALVAQSAGKERERFEVRKELRTLVNTWPFSSVELSKMNAHRQALERLREAHADRRKQWMRIDEGRIVYLFPFGVNGIDYETVRTRLKRAFAEGAGPVRPSAAIDHFTYHADIWEPRLEPSKRFDGLELILPKVRLTIDGDTVEELNAALRFSPMGVHCLRLERTVEDLYPSGLHAAMFRAAREHGTVEVSCEGTDRTWDRLARFARDLILRQLPEALAPRGGEPNAPVGIHRGRSHVLIRVLRASERSREFEPPSGDEDRPLVQDGNRLLELVGSSVLLHSAPDAKESLWDWIRLADDHSRKIWNQRNEGDLLISTENTTVIAALDAPNFISGDLEALAEFTACLGGMMAAWNHQLDAYRAGVSEIIAGYSLPGADRAAQVEAMKAKRMQMLEFESETRQVIALLHSPGLLRSPSNAAELRRLLAVKGIDEQLASFSERLNEVMADQSEATLQRWEVDRQQRVRDSLTAAVSALSVCAAISIWQAAGFWTPFGWGAATVVVAGWAAVYVSARWVSYQGGPWSTARFLAGFPVRALSRARTGLARARMRRIARP